MNEIKNYAELVKEELEKITDGKYQFEVTPVVKSGTELMGITCRIEDSNVAPTIYVNGAFDEHVLPEVAASKYVSVLEESLKRAEEMENIGKLFADYEMVKEHLKVGLFPKNDYSETAIHRAWQDLNIVPYAEFGDGHIVVKPEHLEVWGVSAEEVIDEAMGHIDEAVIRDVESPFVPITIASNKSLVGGAVVMLSDGFAKKALEYYPNGCYILPSSRHELILVDPEANVNALKAMVHEVNETTVMAEDFLSESVYHLSRDGVITIAGTDEAAA